MKILVVGSGGREHALCRAFSKSKSVEKIFCANGNAGIAQIAECIDIKPEDVSALSDFAQAQKIDLTFVGGESALALGIVDEFEKRGLQIIGVSQHAARLESSKSFAKDFMARHGIPTAGYQISESINEAKTILDNGFFGDETSPVVIKADGLAAGKGVVVAANRSQAVEAIETLESLAGKDAAAKIVLEECLTGREVSLLAFCDGENFALMPLVRDHKRIGEGDTGANTGGMGTVSHPELLDKDQLDLVVEKIIKPTLTGCRNEGFPFKGIMFVGLMINGSTINVLEYNVRFGDPETQVILIQLESDLVEICQAIIDQKLDKTHIHWRNEAAACIVLASKNYPAQPATGDVISGLDKINDDSVVVFHAGTAKNEHDQFVTSGGRVLGITASGADLSAALSKAYQAVEKISWDGMQFRRDIGQ